MTAVTNERSRVTMSDRMHVRRSRGALSGFVLVLLGAWGALIPFVGPSFDYAYTPNGTWVYTDGRLWLEILPGAATALGGLMLLLSGNRLVAMIGGWIAALAGLWFCVGPVLSTLWNDGVPAAGVPVGNSNVRVAVEQIGFFTGLGAVIIFFAAVAIGRLTVVGVSDLQHRDQRRAEDRTRENDRSEYGDRRSSDDSSHDDLTRNDDTRYDDRTRNDDTRYDDTRTVRNDMPTGESRSTAPTTEPNQQSTRPADQTETGASTRVTEPSSRSTPGRPRSS